MLSLAVKRIAKSSASRVLSRRSSPRLWSSHCRPVVLAVQPALEPWGNDQREQRCRSCRQFDNARTVSYQTTLQEEVEQCPQVLFSAVTHVEGPTRQASGRSRSTGNLSKEMPWAYSSLKYATLSPNTVSTRAFSTTTRTVLPNPASTSAVKAIHTGVVPHRGASRPPNLEQTLHKIRIRMLSSTKATTATPNTTTTTRRTGRATKFPTPPTNSALHEQTALEAIQNASLKFVKTLRDGIINGSKALVDFLFKLPGWTWFYLTHPSEFRTKLGELKEAARKEANHYWMGTKLLMADLRTARQLVRQTLQGSSLTRRERKQLLRTVSDLFRLVPFSMFVIIPFMEFALPFALRIFPNMLPSTFQDSLKAEENMKRELQSRIAMAQFFQETLEELAKQQKHIAAKRLEEGVEPAEEDSIASQQAQSANSMLKFLEKARSGEIIPPEVIIRYANLFKDDLTLDNMPRMQLINMCRYMGIPPYGADSFLRFQLRHKIRSLREDDQRILWEGIDSLTKMELREACQERGMRSTGLSKDAYKRALQQWLDLSVNKMVPISLLVMSRTFFLREEMIARTPEDDEKSLAGLADAISGLDKEVLNEVILEVATDEERKSDPDVQRIKLEVLTQQNQLIKEEQEEREAAAKKKEAAEKEKIEMEEVTAEPLLTADAAAATEKEPALEKVASPTKFEEEPPKSEPTAALDETDLSTEEMEAISQLLSADPVVKERAALELIKAAMKTESDIPEVVAETDEASGLQETKESPLDYATEEKEVDVEAKIKEMEDIAKHEAETATTFSTESELHALEQGEGHAEEAEEPAEDPVVARLKKRVESMVDKIELQLSDVQVKIGDKLHILDKDMDGILSKEEMVDCLQQVFKRKITHEEALEIAGQMDENADGLLTVQELIKWIETNKLVKFVEEGRDADMDRIMEEVSAESHKEETKEA